VAGSVKGRDLLVENVENGKEVFLSCVIATRQRGRARAGEVVEKLNNHEVGGKGSQ